MDFPGFTAEASLYKASNYYHEEIRADVAMKSSVRMQQIYQPDFSWTRPDNYAERYPLCWPRCFACFEGEQPCIDSQCRRYQRRCSCSPSCDPCQGGQQHCVDSRCGDYWQPCSCTPNCEPCQGGMQSCVNSQCDVYSQFCTCQPNCSGCKKDESRGGSGLWGHCVEEDCSEYDYDCLPCFGRSPQERQPYPWCGDIWDPYNDCSCPPGETCQRRLTIGSSGIPFLSTDKFCTPV